MPPCSGNGAMCAPAPIEYPNYSMQAGTRMVTLRLAGGSPRMRNSQRSPPSSTRLLSIPTTNRQPFAGPVPSQKSRAQVAFRPDLPLEPTAVAGKLPGGRARVRVGSSCPIRLARMPGSTVSPQSRQRTPQIGSLFAEPPASSRRMATMRPRHREQLTSNLPEFTLDQGFSPPSGHRHTAGTPQPGPGLVGIAFPCRMRGRGSEPYHRRSLRRTDCGVGAAKTGESVARRQLRRREG
jgi:hypothetical protein